MSIIPNEAPLPIDPISSHIKGVSSSPGASARPIFLATHARSVSNLFVQLFRKHPELTCTNYNFFNAFLFGPEAPGSELFNPEGKPPPPPDKDPGDSHPTGLEIDNNTETFQKAYDRFLDTLSTAANEGQRLLIKEHTVMIFKTPIVTSAPSAKSCDPTEIASGPPISNPTITSLTGGPSPSNPTLLPDATLLSFTPIILFRHPAQGMPSFYRALSRSSGNVNTASIHFRCQANPHFQVLLHDWYTAQAAALPSDKQAEKDALTPIVIEADDLVHNPEPLIASLCKRLNIDPKYVQYEWEQVPEEKKAAQPLMVKEFLSTLQASMGIIKTPKRDVDLCLGEEEAQWRKEFGEHSATQLRANVEAVMADYWILRGKRMTGLGENH